MLIPTIAMDKVLKTPGILIKKLTEEPEEKHWRSLVNAIELYGLDERNVIDICLLAGKQWQNPANTEAVLAVLAQCAELHPGQLETYRTVINILIGQIDWEGAIAVGETMFDLAPDVPGQIESLHLLTKVTSMSGYMWSECQLYNLQLNQLLEDVNRLEGITPTQVAWILAALFHCNGGYFSDRPEYNMTLTNKVVAFAKKELRQVQEQEKKSA